MEINFIAFQTKEILDEIEYSGLSVDDSVDFIRKKASMFDPEKRIELLRNIKDKFQHDYDEHLKVCKAEIPEECYTNKRLIQYLYFITQDINSLHIAMFSQFQNDTIRIIKKDGTVLPTEIKAMVDNKGLIHIHDIQIDIAEGDFIERFLPNNKTEKYLILDTRYHNAFYGIPARFECKVEKVTAIKSQNNSSTVYHISGNNSRVYNNSIDQSSNILNVNTEKLFSELRQVIQSSIEYNTNLLELVERMEENKGKNTFTKSYTDFIAAAANHISILTPFIPALTEMIKS